MGVGRFVLFCFVFLSCFLNCFKLQMFKGITPPTPTETTVIKSKQWGDWAVAPKAAVLGRSFSKSKSSRLQGEGVRFLGVRLWMELGPWEWEKGTGLTL